MSVDLEIDTGTEQQDEFSPVAPGEILAEEFLAGFALTQAQLARALGISSSSSALQPSFG
jgi:hypothetical protein